MDLADPQVLWASARRRATLLPVLDAADIRRILAAVTVALKVAPAKRRPTVESGPVANSPIHSSAVDSCCDRRREFL